MVVPFAPLGNTVTFTADTVPPTPVQAPVANGQVPVGQYRVVNAGAVTVFLGIGGTAAQATAAAVIPAPSAAGIPVPPGAVEIIRSVGEAYFTAITASGTAVIYVTPGQGI